MTKNAGVWIDHKRAIVVLLTEAGKELKKIDFDIGQPVRSGGARSKHAYTSHDYVAEDKLERKAENDRKDYFDDVVASIRGAAAVLILGPGEAKGELAKHITSKKLRGLSLELRTSDKLSDGQIVAEVTGHFTKSPAGKSVAPTKNAKKKAAGAGSRSKASRTKLPRAAKR